MVLRGLVRVVYQQTRVVSALGFGAGTETSAKEGRKKEMAGKGLNPRKEEKEEERERKQRGLTWLRQRTARRGDAARERERDGDDRRGAELFRRAAVVRRHGSDLNRRERESGCFVGVG
jgi:hypothetical protein